MVWIYHIGYKIEEILENIFSDDGRRASDDYPEL